MEDDSFNVRVDKIFGSLSKPSSSQYTPPPSVRPLWCLTDEEIERREWNRHKDEEEEEEEEQQQRRVPPGNVLDKSALKTRRWLGNLSDDDEDDEEDACDRNVRGGAVNGNDEDQDELEIRASIGLDSTLDNEAEEDAYDKMAQGKEGDTKRHLYMKDATDYGPYLNFHNVLPSSVHDVPRDPRANMSAAKIRLEEDAAVWKAKIASGQTCDLPMPIGEVPFGAVSEDPEDDIITIKPILKRKTDVKTSSTSKTDSIVKSMKRVRFDASCNNEEHEDASDCKNKEYVDASDKSQGSSAETSGSATAEVDDPFSVENIKHRVPDYLVNRGRYTHYTFDPLTNDDEESNTKACMDLFEVLRRSKSEVSEETLDDSSADAPQSLKFVPRKKASEGQGGTISREGNPKQSFTRVGSGARVEVADEGEVCAMEEDEPDLDPSRTRSSSKKPGRNYRTKVAVEEDDA